MKHYVNVVCLIVATVLLAGCVLTNHRVSATKTAATEHLSDSAILVESRNGSVEIVADQSVTDVQVSAKITCTGDTADQAEDRSARASVDVARSTSGTLTIKPVFPGKVRNGDGASFTIRVPNASDVEIRTSNGKVAVSGLAGKLVVDTSNGPVQVKDHDGPAVIETSNGAVTVARLAGPLKIDTSNGPVEASEIDGSAIIDTSNSPITLVLNPDQKGPIRLETSNAPVRVTVGSAFAGEVKFDTSNGSVKLNGNLDRVKYSDLGSSQGTVVIGEGGEPSRIDTSNGRIELVIASS
ncbi:MAG: DUF4097 family beta strand repeat-containing protein [Phycisphaerales bacterium]|nr:DUF4097 family beta strand repeat-containing protein [Phycisphaerales bacterium]